MLGRLGGGGGGGRKASWEIFPKEQGGGGGGGERLPVESHQNDAVSVLFSYFFFNLTTVFS
jgi:hypothetical protein